MWMIHQSLRYFNNYSGITKFCWENIFLILLNAIVVAVSFFIAVYFIETLHFSTLRVGMLMSSYGVGTMLGGVITAKLLSRISAISLAMICTSGQAVILLSLPSLHNVSFLIVSMFFLGFFFYGFKTINSLLIMKGSNSQEDRLKAINTQYSAINLGLIISAVVVAIVADDFTFKNVFYVFGSLAIYTTIHLFLLQKRYAKFGTVNQEAHEINKSECVEKSNIPILVIIFTIIFFTGLVIAQLYSSYPAFLETDFSQYGVNVISLMYVINGCIIVISQTPLINYFSKINKISMLGFGSFCYSTGLFLLLFVHTLWVLIFACVVQTFGEMLFFAVAQMLCYQHANSKHKALVLGLFQTVFAAGITVGPFVGDLIYHSFGAQYVWGACGVSGVLCFSLSWCARALRA